MKYVFKTRKYVNSLSHDGVIIDLVLIGNWNLLHTFTARDYTVQITIIQRQSHVPW
jgi:hypothetical protein